MCSYIIYHPKRKISTVKGIKIYHDSFIGNQDPYIWNKKFLHTYCHITQMTNEPGQINFWVSDDKMTEFKHLYCDCVFVIAEKHYWKNKNHIASTDPIVDNYHSFKNHYEWANFGHHPLKIRRRYTIKAEPDKSFQPQNADHTLIDIMPFLIANGITLSTLHNGIITKVGSRPFKLDDNIATGLYDYLYRTAAIRLYGNKLEKLYPSPIIEQAQSKSCC